MQHKIFFAFLKRTVRRGQPKVPTVPWCIMKNSFRTQRGSVLLRNPSTARTGVPRHSSMAGAAAEPSLQQIVGSQAGARRDAPHEELHVPAVSPMALPGSQSSGTRRRGRASRNTDQWHHPNSFLWQ